MTSPPGGLPRPEGAMPHSPLEVFRSFWVAPPADGLNAGTLLVLVLAGGQGRRLQAHPDPVIARTPKPLVPLDSEHTMLGHTLHELHAAGLSELVVLTGAVPGGEAIAGHALCHNGIPRPGVLREVRPLGTAGAVYAALRHLRPDVTCVVVPVDTLFPYQRIPAMLAAHTASGALVTWAVTTRPGDDAQNAGRLRITHGHLVYAAEHHNRPISCSIPGEPATSAGVMVIDSTAYRGAFADLALRRERPASPVDLYRDLVPWLLLHSAPVGAFDIGCPAPDLGTPERLRRFTDDDGGRKPCG